MPRRKRNESSDDDDEPAPSQRGASQRARAADALDDDMKEKAVADVMRYILWQDYNKVPTKKSDIGNHVMKDHKGAIGTVVQEARKRFADIFGFGLIESEGRSTATFYLSNQLQADTEPPVHEVPEGEFIFQKLRQDEEVLANTALLSIILGLISLSNGVVTEGFLIQQLRRLGLDKDEKHPIFGDWMKLIESKFTKELYITRKKGPIDPNGKIIWEIRAGPRSQTEFPKTNVIRYIAEIFGEEVDEIALKEAEQSSGSSSDSSSSEDERPSQRASQSSSQRGGGSAGRGRGRGVSVDSDDSPPRSQRGRGRGRK
ncbi:melanoma-associated antigen G1-like [Planoprotostelium fungivorum]|uniref:Melanoma-associated antigen G1-like n=1 Tax=Planoprotostelium fungivorum TaxID=1890364 RepID=A0A2P6NK22_9EUKA|nr:melanoma-associated antigen G1-like [Planoprotostelium fungivorum]